MSYIGDFALGSTFDTKFCTVTTTGAPTQLAGTPVISAYVDNSVTQITAGITLTVDFDTVTGLNNVRVVATSGNGYAAGSNYQLVITTGTVGGTSVVGYVVAEFSIEARSSLRPTTSGRTLDVSATGEAGLDWANVGSQSTSVNLSATTTNVVNTATAVTTVNGLAAGTVTAAAVATGAIDADALATDAVTEIRSVVSGTADSGTTTTMVDAARTEADTDYWKDAYILFTSGTISGQCRLITGFNSTTDTITFAPATTQAVGTNTYEILWLAHSPVTDSDDLLKRDMSAVTGEAARSPLNALRFLRNKFSISGTTLTVTKEDDTTSAWTSTLTTDAAANPITASDPA